MKCPKCSGLFHKVLFQDTEVESKDTSVLDLFRTILMTERKA